MIKPYLILIKRRLGWGPKPDTHTSPKVTIEQTPQTSNGSSAAATTDTALTAIKGIGETRAAQLQAAGIETAVALAAADPKQVAKRTEISESRLRRLIDRAGRKR